MKIFLDTAVMSEIQEMVSLGIVDGVTTNPSLLKTAGVPYRELLEEIAHLVPGPISAEVVAEEAAGMVREGRDLASIAENIVVKIPMGREGVKAVRALDSEGIETNMTLVFSANQALLAAKAGASFVSPFIGRLDDAGQTGMDVVQDILEIYANYDFETEVIVASVRHPLHVVQAGLIGADIATVPTAVLKAMFEHPLTDVGKAKFLEAWRGVRKG
ncbi:MAG: fructose-6-phosphate aldolase [Candidatus Eisenbacteria bacterium]|nr:fructose-6-phosphate aldolase [Candidatus Eisenbacteria bacterium]